MKWWGVAILLVACAQTEVVLEQNIPEVETMSLTLTSSAFENNGNMPVQYTQDSEEVSPPLDIAGVPEGTKSLVLINDDPDAPDPAAPKIVWEHWVIFNMPPETTTIPEGGPIPGVVGKNQRGNNAYGGPAPPIGTHRYFFKLYALDTTLELTNDADKTAVEAAMQGHILEQTELIGLYGR